MLWSPGVILTKGQTEGAKLRGEKKSTESHEGWTVIIGEHDGYACITHSDEEKTNERQKESQMTQIKRGIDREQTDVEDTDEGRTD